MKTIGKYAIIAAAAAISFVSCSKSMDEPQKTDTIDLKISTDVSKVVYYNDRVEWVTNDRLIIFDDALGKMGTEKCGASYELTHQFTVSGWPADRTPTYAMFDFSANATSYDDAAISQDGNITAYLASNQNIVNKLSFSQYGTICVGKIASAEDAFSTSLCNVNGLLQFNTSLSGVASITISSTENVDLAGKINIPTSSVDAAAPSFTVVEGEKAVTLTVSGSSHGDGVFLAGKYMAGILPGTFTPVITFKNKEGETIKTITASKQITVSRNEIFNLGTIGPNVLEVGFESVKSNPTSLTATAAGTDATFTLDGKTCVSVGTTGMYWNNALWNTAAGYMTLPAIEGYKLVSVTIAGGNASGKPFSIENLEGATVKGGAKAYVASADLGNATGEDAANAKHEYTWTLSGTTAKTAYNLRIYNTKDKVVKLVLLYSSVD